MVNQSMDEALIKACEILEVDPSILNTLKVRDIILKYRTKARIVHPDKADEDQKAEKTKDFQELNNAYHMILKHVIESVPANSKEEDY